MANVSPPGKRSGGMKEEAAGPVITVARQAIAVSDPQERRMQLSMRDVYTYAMGKDGKAHDSTAPVWTQGLEAPPPRSRRCARAP